MCVYVFQGRLNELMSQIRMQNHFGAVRSEERYRVDADLLREIRQARTSVCVCVRERERVSECVCVRVCVCCSSFSESSPEVR